MEKIKFLTKLQEVKKRLPKGAAPLYLKAFPNAVESRVKNTLSGKIRDEKILSNLEKLASKIESLKSK